MRKLVEVFKKNRKNILILILLGLILILMGTLLLNPKESKEAPKKVSLNEVVKILDSSQKADDIKRLEVNDTFRKVEVVWKDKEKRHLLAEYPQTFGVELFERADKANVEMKVTNTNLSAASTRQMLISMIPQALVLGLIIGLIYFSMGGARQKQISAIPKTRFTDLGGVDEAVEDLGEITSFLQNTSKFKEIGAVTPKGALLAGPPGTGKTELAKAVAGEAGVPFFQASGSDFVEMFVGMGARRVRNLFKAARKHDRAVIFIDELDAVGGKRSGGNDGGDGREHNRTVNALLTQMDGFEDSNVIVLGATNFPEGLDPALLRAGRFDRKISLDLPDWKGRKRILEIHATGKKISSDVDFSVIAKSTTGLSGADLESLVNEALINAVRNGRTEAEHVDFMESLSVITLGRAKKSVVMTDFDKQVVAWHESGHAVVALALDEVSDPSHVTITPRGFSGGHTKLRENEEKFQTSTALKGRLAMMLGGMAAEKKMLGDITQGPGHDLKAATDLANDMVSKMGMGSQLLVIEDRSMMVNPTVSENVRQQAEELVKVALERAENVLNDPKWVKVFNEMTEQLLVFDTIEHDEIQKLKNLAE